MFSCTKFRVPGYPGTRVFVLQNLQTAAVFSCGGSQSITRIHSNGIGNALRSHPITALRSTKKCFLPHESEEGCDLSMCVICSIFSTLLYAKGGCDLIAGHWHIQGIRYAYKSLFFLSYTKISESVVEFENCQQLPG
eukprot:2742095-Rhodomonas_salina.7